MDISIAQFSEALDSIFVAHTSGGEVALTLVEARQAPRGTMPEQFRAPIVLLLSGPPAPVLHDDHYLLDHAVLGRNQWFMAPVSSPGASHAESARQRYQIIFN